MIVKGKRGYFMAWMFCCDLVVGACARAAGVCLVFECVCFV